MRTKAEKKHNDFKKINHKINILKDVYGDDISMYKHDLYNKEKNRLNKAKVHCSCPMCSTKSKVCGMKHSDRVKVDKANYQDYDEYLLDD